MDIEILKRDKERLEHFVAKEARDQTRILALRMLGEEDENDIKDYQICEILMNEFRAGISRIDIVLEQLEQIKT